MIETSLLTAYLQGLTPVKPVTCWEWADENYYLSSESSAEYGKWRTDRVPYMRRIMEDLSPTSTVEQVLLGKGVQVAATTVALAAAATFIDTDPCPILFIMPTLEMVEGLSKERLDPMIANSPALLKKIPPASKRDSGNNIRSKKFPGGSIYLIGSNSASSLRSKSIRLLIMDEIDGYDVDIGNEGSPIALAEKRTVTFPNRKIFKISTPTISGSSAIERELEDSDWNEYHVPCPLCGVYQTLKFGQLKWSPEEKDFTNPDSAMYECEDCGDKIHERFKTKMLELGEWRPKNPDKVNFKKRGYHLSSLYSPYGWLSWAQIAKEWVNAQGSQELLKVFVNTILGETWKEIGDAPAFKQIYARRETYSIGKAPLPVCFITAGIDIQKDRIEMEIVGWSHGKQTHSIDYIVIPGDTEKPEVWDQLAIILNRPIIREDNAELSILMSGIDTGYNTTIVYDFCRKFDASRIMAVRGQESQVTILTSPKEVQTSATGKKLRGLKLWNIGVNILKSEIYNYLRLEPNEDGSYPAGYCHFPQYDMEHFKRLTAEQLLTKKVHGYPKTYWEKVYERNEQLDCRVYARAAAAHLQIDRMTSEDYSRIHAGYLNRTKNAPPPKKERKDSFWNGRRD